MVYTLKQRSWQQITVMLMLLCAMLGVVALAALTDDYLFYHGEIDKDFRYWKVINTRRSNHLYYLNYWVAHRMHDGYPIMFHSKKGRKQAIVCMYPKGGSTLWKYLLQYGMIGINKPLRQILRETPHSQPYRANGVKEFRGAMEDMNLPRFLVVRNPYVRFLSAYLDKVKDKKDRNFLPPGFIPGQSFEIFVQKMLEYQKGYNSSRWGNFNDHFSLMSKSCALPAGMTYDYVLPLEQMDHWYEAFIRTLGLVEETRTGWNITTPVYKGDPNVPCFYRVQGKTCEQMFANTTVDTAVTPPTSTQTIVANTAPSPSSSKNRSSANYLSADYRTNHATNSATQLSQYINSPTMLNALTQWMVPDLLQFRYPIWDGHNPVEYVKSLSQRSLPPTLHYSGNSILYFKNLTDDTPVTRGSRPSKESIFGKPAPANNNNKGKGKGKGKL